VWSEVPDKEDSFEEEDDKLDNELELPDEEWERGGGDGDGDGEEVSSQSKRVSFGIGPNRDCCAGVR
jgi:hypothetical protein